MSIENPPAIAPASPAAVKRGYEITDVSPKLILILAGVFVIFGLIVGIGVWAMYRRFETRPRSMDEPASVLEASQTPRGGVPLQPQEGHELTDAQDLHAMHARENATFEKLGWHIDEKTGTPQVPASVIAALRARPGPTTQTTQPASKVEG